MSSEFVHLHVHTEFSLLDGQSQIKDLVARADELDMSAVGITDHGVMFGVIDFYRAAKGAGLTPVIGMEAYLAPRTRHDKDATLDKRPYHMLLLAQNKQGYQNLIKLASIAQLEGYYYRPRIDWEVMNQYSEGLIATSGCLAAEIPRLVEEGQEDEARQRIGRYLDVFGEDNFYLELQPHDIDQLHILNKWLHDYRKSNHTNVQFLATNDVHYVRKDDWDAHDTLLCIQTSTHKSADDRMKLQPYESYHLKSADEMRHEFRAHGVPDATIDEAFANSLKVAQMTHLELDFDTYHLPVFPVPPEFKDEGTYLRYLVEMGLSWRFPGRENDDVLHKRIDRELGIIGDMGFNTYFLIVWDLCEFAREVDIWWNVRGSGAGSLVAYCLGITNIDPIQNSLLFERFLNPGRVSMPDIDLDYPDDRRAEMIAYTADKYGKDKVAAIITFGTMGAKGAVRDVGRALDVDLAKVNYATSLIPQEARQKTIREYIDANPELSVLYKSDDDMRRVMDTAINLQGMTRHASTHAAGVIVADKRLDEYVPLHRITGTDPSGGSLNAVTQFPMETAESIGLLKVDFLGLSTLTILRKACDLINRHHGTKYTMDNIPYRHDDQVNELTEKQLAMLDEAFEMMGRGETIGVFQVESPGMQSMLRGMRPKTFENIVAGISLYRPGPMELIPDYNNRLHGEEFSYKHNALEPILKETFGIIVYQEQIMQIAGQLFDYELGEADLIRKAVSKKKEKELAKHQETFLERGPKNGVDVATAQEIFDDIMFFANYGFNKAHASDYAVITVQSAFLKCHYPHEFMTALLCVQFDDSEKVATFLEECRRLDIDVLPPHVNHSHVDFDIEDIDEERRGIRFGLGAIKNAGVGALQPIIDERLANGAFTSLEDFCHRVDLRQVGKRALESLIKVGALSGFGQRDALLHAVERIIGFSADYHHAQEVGQMSLFGGDSGLEETLDIREAPVGKRFTRREQLAWEKELLGLYVTGRPVDRHKDKFQAMANLSRIQKLTDPENPPPAEKQVLVAGEIVSLRKVITKNNNQMAILHFEDWHESAATIEVVIFPRIWSKVKEYVRLHKQSKLTDEELEAVDDTTIFELTDGDIVRIQGKFDNSRGEPQIICETISFEFETMTPEEIVAEQESQAQRNLEWADDSQYDYYDEEIPPVTGNGQTGYAAPEKTAAPANGHHANGVSYNTAGNSHSQHNGSSADYAHTNNGHENNGGNGHAAVHQEKVHQEKNETSEKNDNNENGYSDDFLFADDLLTEQHKAQRAPLHICVHFQRTANTDRDRRRLHRIYQLLIGYPGRDTFELIIEEGDQETILDFPEYTTGLNDALRRELTEIVGADNIRIVE